MSPKEKINSRPGGIIIIKEDEGPRSAVLKLQQQEPASPSRRVNSQHPLGLSPNGNVREYLSATFSVRHFSSLESRGRSCPSDLVLPGFICITFVCVVLSLYRLNSFDEEAVSAAQEDVD